MKNYINLVTVLAAFMVLFGCENPDATIDGDEIELSNVAPVSYTHLTLPTTMLV